MEAALLDLFRRFNQEALSVYDHITGQQQISNVSIERSIELYLVKHGLDESAFSRLRTQYHRVRELAETLGLHRDKCSTCPEPPTTR